MSDELLAEPSTGETVDSGEADEQVWDDPLAEETDLQKAFLSLYEKCCSEDRYPRLIEVKDCKQAENYWAGRQYWYWSDRDETWKPAPGVGISPLGDLDFDEMPRFEFVTNIYQATGLTEIGAVAGAPPRIRFFPDDADEETDIETADGRTKLTKLIQRWNPPQLRLQREMYHFWTGGFVALWTKHLPDEKLGFDSVQGIGEESSEVEASIHCPACGWSAPANEAAPPVPCPQCGTPLGEENVSQEEPIPVPVDTEAQEVPRGRQVIEVYGALNCKRPQHTNEQSEWHYFSVEREIHYSILRAHAATEDIADQIRPGMNFGPDDAFERNARLAVAENAKLPTQTGAKQSSLVTKADIWFRPSAYWMMDDKAMRQKAQELFPHGIHVEFAGTAFYKSEAQSMDDAIVSGHAMPGRGQHRPAIGTSMISVQDRFNTFSNICAETYEYGIPITYRASDTFAAEADAEQRAAPGLEVEVMMNPGESIGNKIMQVRADSTSPDMQKHMSDLFGPQTQYLSGAFPALTGAADTAPDTLGQQAMQRDQAMGRMGVFYVPLKQMEADIMTLSCKDFEQHAGEQVNIPTLGESGDFETDSVDITALEGDATAYPEGDENFPELWNQQRATMMQISDTPQGQALLSDMGNRQLFAKLIGIPDLKIPELDAWQKQLKEINDLTRIPKDDALLAGIAPQVEIDSDDFHEVESACCKWWMNSPKGQKVKRDNPLGWYAVKEHKAQHDQAIPAPQPEEKPMSETFTTAFKDLPPEAQAQVLEKMGIHVSPQDFINKVLLDKAAKPAPRPFPPPNGAGDVRPNAQ